MKKQTLVRDATVMLLALFAAYAMVMLTQAVMGRIEGVAMLIFMLAVFVTSMYTEGYAWGVAASLISVLAVNFAFLSPYFAFNFTLSENLFSGLVMLVVSIMTSTLTTRIKKQEQLRMESEKEKMRANLLRAVSHDLRTPLTSIYGACSTVIENYDSLDKEKTIKLLGEACSDAQWLTRMVENLLSVTRMTGEQTKIKKEMEAGEEVLSAAAMKIKKHYPDIDVSVHAPQELLMIPMDVILIEQVLINLMENAALHGGSTTRIELHLRREGDSALFEVADNGCGVSAADLPRVFEKGFTGDNGRTTKRATGIGLYLVARLCSKMGIDVTAASEPGEGFVVTFAFSTNKFQYFE